MEEKKTSKGLIWIIVVLIVLIVGLVGYIIYDKVYMNNMDNIKQNATTIITTTKKQTDKVSFGEIDDVDVQYLFDNFINVSSTDNGCLSYEFKFNSNKEIKYDDLTKQEKMMLLTNFVHQTNEELKDIDTCGDTFVEIDETELLDIWKKVFGNKEIKLDDEFSNDFVRFEKADNNKYKAFYIGCFGCEDSFSSYKFLESKKSDTSIEIKVAYVETENTEICDGEEDNNCKYITTISSCKKENCKIEDIEKYINDLPQYKFVFEKNDNDYIFDKIIKLN